MSTKPRRILLGLAIAAMLVDLGLLARQLSFGAGSGCALASCGEVWASRWAQFLGLPMAALGLLVHGAVVVSVWRCWSEITTVLVAMMAGAAVWLVGIQALVLQQYCPFCLVSHGCSLVLAGVWLGRRGRWRSGGRAIAVGIAAVMALAILQTYGPGKGAFKVEPVSSRLAIFDGGRKSFDVARLPHLGPLHAPHVLVEYFDYQCGACRQMSGHLQAFAAKHPKQICLVLLPVPLERECNDAMPSGMVEHPGGCLLAKWSLEVWQANPQVWPELHMAFLNLDESDPDAGRVLVRRALGRAPSQASGEWVEALLRSNADDWRALSGQTWVLPKLLFKDRRISHGLPRSREEFFRVMEQQLNL